MPLEEDRALQAIHELMAHIRQEAESVNVRAIAIAARTRFVATTVLVVLAFVGGFLLLMVRELTHDFLDLLHHMNVMYEHFVIMAGNMETITQQITSMNQHMAGVPAIADDMVRMNQEVAAMQATMTTMSTTMAGMEHNVTAMAGMTTEMAGRFGNVNATVQGMGYNVNQMARPTGMMDTINPFGMMGPFR